MDYVIDLYKQNPVAFLGLVAAVLGPAVAWVALFRKPKYRSTSQVGGNARIKARDISGTVVMQTGGGTIGDLPKVDLTKEDDHHEWAIYEVAFLWHDKEPPGVAAHFQKMTREIEATKNMLHAAVNEGKLRVTREYRSETGVARYVSREELVRFALATHQKPKFLFPETR